MKKATTDIGYLETTGTGLGSPVVKPFANQYRLPPKASF